MTAEDLVPGNGIRPFAIMKRLAWGRARKSRPPPRAHYPRIPGAFPAGHVIVDIYPLFPAGSCPRSRALLKQRRMMAAVVTETTQVIFRRLLRTGAMPHCDGQDGPGRGGR